MNTLDDYKIWLHNEMYTPSTIDASLKVLRRLDLKDPKPTHVDGFLLRRYLRYVKETRRNPLGKQFTEALEGLGLTPATPRAMSGSRKRELLTLKQLLALEKRCAQSDDKAAKLVGIFIGSNKKPKEFLTQKIGLEISAVFKVNRDVLRYEILSPSLTWAYRMMLAAAKREGKKLDIDVDLDILYRSRLALL